MSRHGSGKRRRTSQEPQDTGSHASGEYATPDSGAFTARREGYDAASPQDEYAAPPQEGVPDTQDGYDPDPRTYVDATYETPAGDGFDALHGASASGSSPHADETHGTGTDTGTGTGMRPTPPPLEGDIVKLVGVGSLIWVVLFLVAWLERDSLGEGREWWPWCAIAGAGLGLFGLWYCRRLRDANAD